MKKQLFEQLARIGRSLASPQRIEMLDYLAQAERSVDELAQLCSLSVANTSRHLQQLRQAGLVSVRQQGQQRCYQLAGSDVVQLVQHLRQTAETHLGEVPGLVKTLLPDQHKTPVITSQALAEQLKHTPPVLLDVRPAKEYQQGHIKGAIHVLPENMDETLEKVSQLQGTPIVAYCRGPYCVYSHRMVTQLQQAGHQAWRLAEGFPEWKAAGLPFEVGTEQNADLTRPANNAVT